MKKILFIDRVHPILEARLIQAGFTFDCDFSATYSEITEKIEGYHGLVIRSRIPIDRAFLKSATQLEFIARSGAGLENIDLESAAELDIEVYNSPEGNMDAVGEHAMGMLLSLFNKLNKADREVRDAVWDREGNRGIELSGKTVGIIGFGHMGSAFAKRLQGFDCRILAFDKYKKSYAPNYVEETSLEEVKAESDVISIHLPLSEETNGYVNTAFIDTCAKNFFLINTARGKHVVIKDLLKGLENGKIRGACLDVLEFEKSSFDVSKDDLPQDFKKLTELDNVILSPHVAGWTQESYVKLSTYLADKILRKHTSF